jgi:hypothetical protein
MKNWITIYITGIKKYQVSVEKGLLKSKLVEGRDYIHGANGSDYALLWIRDDLDLREVKLAIGSKYVWKHRMRFFKSYDEMKPKESNSLNDTDKELIARYKKLKLKKSYA